MSAEIDLEMFYRKDEEGNSFELSRPETKSYGDVIQCIEHHKGKPHKAIEMFLGMYRDGLKWDWLHRYKEYKAECLKIETNNKKLNEGEEPFPLPEEPTMSKDRSDELKHIQLDFSQRECGSLSKTTRGY